MTDAPPLASRPCPRGRDANREATASDAAGASPVAARSAASAEPPKPPTKRDNPAPGYCP